MAAWHGRPTIRGRPASRAAAHSAIRAPLIGIEEMGQDIGEVRSLLSMAAARGGGESQRLMAQIDRAVAHEHAARSA